MKKYSGEYLGRTAFPLGGIGAGMYCIEGSGSFGSVSLKNISDLNHEPKVFSAVSVKGLNGAAKVLEGPVPRRKIMDKAPEFAGGGCGLSGRNYGYPRFRNAVFESAFPYASVTLTDEAFPLEATVKAWSPFVPGNPDDSSLPCATLEYTFKNKTDRTLDAVYYYCATNFMLNEGEPYIDVKENGFVLGQKEKEDKPCQKGAFYAFADENVQVNAKWFRGGWFDTVTMLWNEIEKGVIDAGSHEAGKISEGAHLAVPFTLKPGEEKTIPLNTCWYVPDSDMRRGFGEEGDADIAKGTYKPWYSSKFDSVESVAEYYTRNKERLNAESKKFSDCLFDSTLPEEVMDAVSANLSILKSPTVLRKKDGALWCWEGSFEYGGSCYGSCTHVWNYAQALPHLFPSLERSLRHTEFYWSQNEEGHQNFRSNLPEGEAGHSFHAASDGQLGGIMKVFRDWKISGDTGWLEEIWPRVKSSLEYCIKTWDKKEEGILREPHHNTYDIEFWGADGMCSSFYLGALRAAGIMAEQLGESGARYDELYKKGRKYLEEKLFNGEYFIQEVEWDTLEANFDYSDEPDEAKYLLEKEGPKYQYKTGCLSDGILGAWMAQVCGVGEILDPDKVKSHLLSVYKYNFKRELYDHANPQRPGYALGKDGGLLLCSWPKGGKPSLPFVYSDEVWTGIEYQVAGHLILSGCIQEGTDIVKTCRNRYDGKDRNPFDEYECGHWYARALASYGLLQAFSGAEYDAVNKVLKIEPRIKGDCKMFFAAETGFGMVGVANGKPYIEVKSGEIEVSRINYISYE